MIAVASFERRTIMLAERSIARPVMRPSEFQIQTALDALQGRQLEVPAQQSPPPVCLRGDGE